MEHVRWLAEPNLDRPVMLCAFTGWNDAGDAASTAVRTLVEQWGADALAEVDPELFTDFATVRPHVRLAEADGRLRRHIVWPTVGVWSAALPGGDVVLVLGPEPALRWRLFSEQLVGIAEHLGVRMTISLGALLADVPHSRPVQLIGTATDVDLMDRYDLQRSRYEGPTGIVGVLHDACTTAGVATASLWAAVPGYAAQVPSPKAALALVERTCSMIGAPAPLTSLTGGADEYDARVAALIADDEDIVEYVTRLEALVDDEGASGTTDDDVAAAAAAAGAEGDDGPLPDPGALDPGSLVAEVERFLRDQD